MSYTKTVKVEMQEGHLPFLQTACVDLGLNWLEGQQQYQTHEGIRTCVHAIQMEGVRHTIGVVRQGDKFNLACDFYGSPKLRDQVGQQFEHLMQRLSTNMAKHELYEQGARDIREEVVEEDERVRLVATF